MAKAASKEPAKPEKTSAEPKTYYKLLSPRPTVLVTTMDLKGRADVSPFSFVSPVSFDPPLLMIAVGLNKHSYWNITQKKEFVVNIPTEKMLDKVWIAGEKWDQELSKIERAGLKTAKAEKVGPPLLAECVANFECYVEDAKKVGDHVIIIGRVVKIHVNPEFLDEEGRLRVDLVRPPLHVSENVFAFPYVTKNA
ncbi:MAG: flavin reductase family protein [archaeon]